jgi:hypothetical protein
MQDDTHEDLSEIDVFIKSEFSMSSMPISGFGAQ